MLALLLLAALCADPDAKVAEPESVPANFEAYFERADALKSEVVAGGEAAVARAKIAVNSSGPAEKANSKKALGAAESELKAMKKMKPFAYLDPRKVGSVGMFLAIDERAKVHEEIANVVGVIDSKTVVVVGVASGLKFVAVLKVSSTKGMTTATRIGPTRNRDQWTLPQKSPWVVTGDSGLDDERVSALLRLKADEDSVPIMEQIDAGGLEKHRKAFDAAKAEKP